MHYQLTQLDTFVDTLTISAMRGQPIEQTVYLQWQELAQLQPVQMKERLLQDVFSHTEEKAVQLYIQNVQMVLTRLLDKVFELAQTSIQFQDIIHPLQKGLNDVFQYVEQNLSAYFSRNQLIPLGHQQPLREQLSATMQLFKEQHASSSINPLLLDIALQPVADFTDGKYPITYRELDYYNKLLYELRALPSGTDKDITTQLAERLNSLNFNSGDYLHYLIGRMKTILPEADSLHDQLDICRLELKLTNQWQLPSPAALYPEAKSIQVQFRNWLKEEIRYLRSLIAEQAVQDSHPQNPMADDTKINLSVSVGILGFLLRLFWETGIITNKNKADVIRFFSAYFRTARSENIPYKHLRNQYDTPRLGAINITKDLLKKLLQWSDKF